MNATQRLIRAAETALPLVHPNHYHELAKAIAAAKEEQEGPPIQPPNSIEKAARRIRASAKEDAEGSPHERAVIAAFQDCMGVGGVPSDAEFFEEFTQRLAGQLGIPAADKEGQAKVLTDEEIQRQSEHSGRFLFLSALCANVEFAAGPRCGGWRQAEVRRGLFGIRALGKKAKKQRR